MDTVKQVLSHKVPVFGGSAEGGSYWWLVQLLYWDYEELGNKLPGWLFAS